MCVFNGLELPGHSGPPVLTVATNMTPSAHDVIMGPVKPAVYVASVGVYLRSLELLA